MFRAFWGAALSTGRWAGTRARVLLASIIEGIIKTKVGRSPCREFSRTGSGVAENSGGESEFRNSPPHSPMIESRQIKLNDRSTVTMSEEPLFDSSLKKKSKKKQVAFTEDPLGADADPTQPAPDVIDNRTTNGEAVDMGPTTAHEQLAKQQSDEVDDDFKAMFGGAKKKKKSKKEIPLDLVRALASITLTFT